MRSILAGLRTLILPWGAGPNQPAIVIGPTIPPEVTAHYASFDMTVHAIEIFRKDANDYGFRALVESLPAHANHPFFAMLDGSTFGGTVETDSGLYFFDGSNREWLLLGSGNRIDTIWVGEGGTEGLAVHKDIPQTNLDSQGDIFILAADQVLINGPSGILIGSGTATFTGDVQYGGISHGRGYIGSNETNNGALVTTAAEAAVPAASWDKEPSFTFVADRCYRVVIQYGAYASAATDTVARVRVRKGSASTTGQQLAFWQASMTSANVGSSSVGSFHGIGYVKNNSGSNVTTDLSVTIERQSGAANVTLYGDSDMPVVLTVEDIGDADETVNPVLHAVEIA
jgi:hypothetical protein